MPSAAAILGSAANSGRLYLVSSLCYIAIGAAWAFWSVRHWTRGFHVHLHAYLSRLILLKVAENVLVLAAIICIDLRIEAYALLVVADLVTLISIACFYALLAVICKGIGVTKTRLDITDRQIVLVTGLSTCIIDLMTSGNRQIYTITLSLAYLLLLRVLLLQLDRHIAHLASQITLLRQEPRVPRALGDMLYKKLLLMTHFRILLMVFMISTVGIRVGAILGDADRANTAEMALNIITTGTISWLFRLQRPTVVHLFATPSGRLAVTIEDAAARRGQSADPPASGVDAQPTTAQANIVVAVESPVPVQALQLASAPPPPLTPERRESAVSDGSAASAAQTSARPSGVFTSTEGLTNAVGLQRLGHYLRPALELASLVKQSLNPSN
ncbi:hypothetical protein HK105_200728 [Polyrhizophydium stewartii]|uniref:GOST seven transmembrane domain-containing protein n=1 Tax=Polyrhizophydium stewartii TaxID=2732419 RepID=A0ABR4NJX0_9FUNG